MGWKVVILNGHLWDNCDYVVQTCVNQCTYTIDAATNNTCDRVQTLYCKDMADHLANKCPKRKIECTNCGDVGEYELMAGRHLEKCPRVRIPCPNYPCPEKLPRCEVASHCSIECDYEPVPCKYLEIGCQERPLRKDLETHEKNAQPHHQFTADAILQMKQDNDIMAGTNLRLMKAVTGLLDTVSEQRREISELKSESDPPEKSLLTTVKKFKLNNFEKYKRNNSPFRSKAFYTSPSGYNMYLRVYANGRWSGKGTHVSVFVYLTNGDNDNSLTWPFTGTVEIELLNQLEDKNHHKNTIQFREENKIVPGQGLGSEHFISHSAPYFKNLPRMSTGQEICQYVKNDTLFFRVSTTVPSSNCKPWLGCTI